MSGIKVKTFISRRGISDLVSFVGLPFLSPTNEQLGTITAVDDKPGPYCEITIRLEETKLENVYIRQMLFPNDI